jgi:hypothetical protein
MQLLDAEWKHSSLHLSGRRTGRERTGDCKEL